MSEFSRGFRTDVIEQELGQSPIIGELFRNWVLPGDASGFHGLRVAIRDGYLNLYVGGQSVAKVGAGSRGVTVTIHEKYLLGAHAGSEKARQCGQRYKTLKARELAPPDAEAKVEQWITAASTYCGAEKLFVDSLVGNNPTVIDLEMALPGDPKILNENGNMVSPRMDLVTIDRGGAGGPALNFWEVKCANNSELRASRDIRFNQEVEEGAPVAHQLARYMCWLRFDARVEAVCVAYQGAAAALLELARIFGKDLNSEACRNWASLRDRKPALVRRPGIVIGNYHPRPKTLAERQKMRQMKHSFSDPHCDRLKRLGLTVLEYDNFMESSQPLPGLVDGSLGDWCPPQ